MNNARVNHDIMQDRNILLRPQRLKDVEMSIIHRKGTNDIRQLETNESIIILPRGINSMIMEESVAIHPLEINTTMIILVEIEWIIHSQIAIIMMDLMAIIVCLMYNNLLKDRYRIYSLTFRRDNRNTNET
jgi:hypothetical protein